MSDRFCTCFGCTSDKPTRCEYAESDIVTALRAEVERLTRERDEARADLREARMQAITDAGQVQEAYEVKRAAEAERDRLREALEAAKAYIENLEAHEGAEGLSVSTAILGIKYWNLLNGSK